MRKSVQHGQVAGYIVLTWNKGMGWLDDWDGQVHGLLADGQAALRECLAAGHPCILTCAVMVGGSAPLHPTGAAEAAEQSDESTAR